jgi:hypothetical protein
VLLGLVYQDRKRGDVDGVGIAMDQRFKVMGGVMLEDCTVVLHTCIANKRMASFPYTFVVESPDVHKD